MRAVVMQRFTKDMLIVTYQEDVHKGFSILQDSLC